MVVKVVLTHIHCLPVTFTKWHGDFAVDIVAEILPIYTDYFNIKYLIVKAADQIAILDFAMG